MADEIVVDLDVIQMVVDKMASIEQEIDEVTSELFAIKIGAGDGWQGDAREIFSDNCHALRQKSVEVFHYLQTDREKLQNATGVLVRKEEENKRISQDLRADNIFS